MEILKNKYVSFLKKHKKQLLFYLFLNFCFAVCITLSSYIHTPLVGFKDYSSYVIHFFVLQFSVAGFIYFFTINRWVFRLVFLPLFFFFSLFSYWVYTQDISVTSYLIQASIETRPSIVFDLLSGQYILFIIAIIIVLFFLNKIYKKVYPIELNIPLLVLAVICVFSFYLVENIKGGTFKSKLPYSTFYGFVDYLEKDNSTLKEAPNNVYDSIQNIKIVLILGESVRADHLQLNGYSRRTTPLLNSNENVVSFKNISTEHTYTASSLPRIITNATVETESLSNLISVFDVFNKCNYNTIWFGNQELERSYESIARTNKEVVLIDGLHSVRSYKKALDEKLLNPFEDKFYHEEKGLYTMHMMGSHWWYENRYTDNFRKFKPVVNSKYIPSSSVDQMINSYDNTLVYLDFFLNEIINIQKKINQPTILIYISDHGESLGENNKWLHGQDMDVTKNPAMLVWYSDGFKAAFPDKVKALRNNKNKDFTTDVIYTSLMDLINVKNLSFNKRESMFYYGLKGSE